MSEALLKLTDLSVTFATDTGPVEAVRNLSLSVAPGETAALVGESGAGKTTAAMAGIGLMAPNARVTAGSIAFMGRDMTRASRRDWRPLRGTAVSLIFQHPRAALNPLRRIGRQIADAIRAHEAVSRQEAQKRALELLRAVRFPDPDRQIAAYPHELSGGMCQRAIIAIAIAGGPKLLIADEPTTGLDATTQQTVMALLQDLTRNRGMALLLITHDLALAAQYADRTAVMQNGRLIEEAPSRQLFHAPRHDYTRRLVAATPLRDTRIEDLAADALPPGAEIGRQRDQPLLELRALRKVYGNVAAVDGVSFRLARGQSLGLVGESGTGKSTIARLIARLTDPTSGDILFDGENVGLIGERRFHASPHRRDIQLIFQDPTDSLYPRYTAFQAIADPLRRLEGVRSQRLRERVASLAEQVRFPRDLLDRRPHQLSGGQKARIGIARAISVSPRLLILDEPTTSLDVSMQAVILHLLERLKRELGLSYLFISHDLNVVKMMCDRTIVLKAGRIVEEADSREIFAAPKTDYTRRLLEAVPHFEGADERRPSTTSTHRTVR